MSMISNPARLARGTSRGVGSRLRRLDLERRRTAGWSGLLYVLPALTLLALFEVWPLLFGAWISLWKWDIFPVEFVGPDNFIRLFSEGFVTRDYAGRLAIGEVLNSLIVTLYYALFTIPVSILSGFAIAYLLFRGRKGEGALRTMYFLPHITASVAVTVVFSWMFDAQVGVANGILESLGMAPQRWLNDPTPVVVVLFGSTPLPYWASGPSMALAVVILYGIWASVGLNVVIYLASLTSISKDVLEAACIDGASEWHLIRSIIWPLSSPTTYFLLITSTIGAFKVFDPIFTLTRGSAVGGAEAGGPLDTTLTITVYIYRYFYERQNSVGYAAATAILLFAILLLLSAVQVKLSASKVHYQ